MTARLPAAAGRAGVVGDTAPPLPALAAAAGDQASVRFLEFFAAAIRSCAHRAIVTYGCTQPRRKRETVDGVSPGLRRPFQDGTRDESRPQRDEPLLS